MLHLCAFLLRLCLLHHALSLVSDNPYFQDLEIDVMGLGMSAYMLAAQAAQNLGLGQLAVQYAHEALTFHKNPVKMYYAHVKLGAMLRGIEKE